MNSRIQHGRLHFEVYPVCEAPLRDVELGWPAEPLSDSELRRGRKRMEGGALGPLRRRGFGAQRRQAARKQPLTDGAVAAADDAHRRCAASSDGLRGAAHWG
eukprot:2882968-Pleurochrysis_carterae.AAC.2